MRHRPPHVLAAGALLLLAAPALSSCGFDLATDRVNTIGVGVTNRDASVDVVGAVVVAEAPGSGTFIATLANNSESEAAVFADLQPEEGLTAAQFEPVDVPARGYANLAEDGGVRLSGDDLAAGQFVSVSVGFDTGELVTLEVPVVKACDQYVGVDNAAGASESGGEPYSCEPPEAPGEGAE